MIRGWLDVNSRFYNTASACDGTYGMFIPAEPPAATVSNGEAASFNLLSYSPLTTEGFRVNIGFLNASGGDTRVKMRLSGDDGELLGTRGHTLKAWEHRQFTRIHTSLATPPVTHGWARVDVVTPGGRVFAYALAIVNVSGDPVFMTPWLVHLK